MTARTLEAFRWEKFVFIVFAPFSVGLLCLWGFAVEIRYQKDADVPRLTVDASANARRYIVQHPMDSVGWLALAESALIAESNKPPSFSATQAIAIAAVLAPVDGQVLRGQALSAIRAGDIATGLSHAATMAVLFPAESRNAFAILRAYGNHPAWPGFFQNQLDSRWPAAESFLLDSCQVGAPLQTLIAMAQPVIHRQSLSENTINCIGTKAIAEGQVSTAYWLWINALASVPSPLGNVFNGEFERPLAGHLFDWKINAGGDYREGFAAAVRLDDSRGSRNKVLTIKFNGRELKPPIAQQFLALAPGRYVLSYNVREIELSVPSVVTWTVRCVPATLAPVVAAIVGQPAQGGWIRHTRGIVIPEGCTGQLIDLEVGNRLQMSLGLRGSVHFDDVTVVRQ